MKFSERFFKFPIKIYDSASVKNVIKEEFKAIDNDTDAEPLSPAWVRGFARIPYWSLNDIYYYDSYSPGEKTLKQIAEDPEKGFDMTAVFHKEFGTFDCTWRSRKFEEELNKFTEAYEKFLDEEEAIRVEKELT